MLEDWAAGMINKVTCEKRLSRLYMIDIEVLTKDFYARKLNLGSFKFDTKYDENSDMRQ